MRLYQDLHRLGELVEGLADGQHACLLLRLHSLSRLLLLHKLRIHGLLSLARHLSACDSWEGKTVLEPQRLPGWSLKSLQNTRAGCR